MAGVAVSFAITEGGGSLAVENALTNTDGVATSGSWTLGTIAGANTVTANVAERSAQFTATGVASAPATMLVEGDGQEALVGDPLPEPIRVTVRDAHDNPIAGVEIAASVKAGAGFVGSPTYMTNAAGSAQIEWTLGHVDVLQELAVSAAGTSLSSTVSATPIVPMLKAAEVSAGEDVACALRASGQITCWGTNDPARLGDGTRTFRPLPVPVAAGGLTFGTVAYGMMHGCALTLGGAAYCWGTALSGDGTTVAYQVPMPVHGGHVFSRIALSSTRTCALDVEGRGYCWGANNNLDASQPVLVPQLVSESLRFVEISVGRQHECAIAESGATYCWGVSNFGALGTGTGNEETPREILGNLRLTSVSAGESHSCGLDGEGRAYCWGSNTYGRLGVPMTTSMSFEPIAAAGELRFVALRAGDQHTCGLVQGGTAYCWGANLSGQLGNNMQTFAPTPTPQQVQAPAGVSFRSIAPGHGLTCGVATDDQVYCWGARVVSADLTREFDLVARAVRGR